MLLLVGPGAQQLIVVKVVILSIALLQWSGEFDDLGLLGLLGVQDLVQPVGEIVFSRLALAAKEEDMVRIQIRHDLTCVDEQIEKSGADKAMPTETDDE